MEKNFKIQNNDEMIFNRAKEPLPMKKEEFLAVLCDFYKTSHDRQYNKNISKIYASFIPRMTRFDKIDHVLMFGLQSFIKEHLMYDFQKNFFNLTPRQFNDLMKDLEKQLLASVPDISYINLKKFRDLYELGHLPITINALPEGLLVPIKVPMFEIIAEGKFAWLGNFLETYMSTELWYPMTVGSIAYEYRKLVHEFLQKTSDFIDSSKGNISEFGSRGNTSWQSAMQASAAWLTCHDKSSNVAVESYLKSYYDLGEHVKGMISTEHSVMCSNYAIDGDEVTFLKKLLTELYPSGNISVVMDSYDYWNVIENILPTLKDIICDRNGCLFVRGDCYDDQTEILTDSGWMYFKDLDIKKNKVFQVFEDGSGEFVEALRYINKPYQGEMYSFNSLRGGRQLLVTPNHNMVLISKEGKYELKQAKDIDIIKHVETNKKFIPTSSRKKGTVDKLSDIDRLKIAYQADGRTRDTKVYEDEIKKVEDKNTDYFRIEFNLSKQRKIDRLIEIINRLGLEYKITKPESNNISKKNKNWKDQTTIYIRVNELFSKKLSNWVDLSDKSYKWCREFIDECVQWDGEIPSTHDHRNIRNYFTTDYENAVIVQTIGALAGYHTNFTSYVDPRKDYFKNSFTVSMNITRPGEYIALFRQSIREGYNGHIYCVTVPSSRIMVRRGDQIFVSGNSGNPVEIVTETVFKLWDIFGGTTNSKGYKVLNSHIRAVYGDSITLTRAKKIFKILEEKGFDITNVSLGAGSFSMLCLEEENGVLKPFTRDSFGFALKTTLVVYEDGSSEGRGIPVVKQPKTDNENFKKSYSGRVAAVFKDPDTIVAMDNFDHTEIITDNLLQPVFKDGKLLRDESFDIIRRRINEQIKGVSKMIVLNTVK